eukprot:265770-Rhodomonas_salina.1
MSGTDIARHAISLPARYGISGTNMPYHTVHVQVQKRRQFQVGDERGTGAQAYCARQAHAMDGGIALR